MTANASPSSADLPATRSEPLFGTLLTAMITVFAEDGSVDLDATAATAEQLVDDGCDGLVVCGTTGEYSTMTDDENLSVFRAVKDAVGSRVPLLAGTGSNDTEHSRHLSRAAEKIGMDGLLIVCPYYNKPSQAGVEAHERGVPVMRAMALEFPGDPAVEYLDRQYLLGRDLFWWLTTTKVIHAPAHTKLGRRLRANEPVIGTSRRTLRRAGVEEAHPHHAVQVEVAVLRVHPPVPRTTVATPLTAPSTTFLSTMAASSATSPMISVIEYSFGWAGSLVKRISVASPGPMTATSPACGTVSPLVSCLVGCTATLPGGWRR